MESRLLYIDTYQHAVLSVIDAHDGTSMDSWERSRLHGCRRLTACLRTEDNRTRTAAGLHPSRPHPQ